MISNAFQMVRKVFLEYRVFRSLKIFAITLNIFKFFSRVMSLIEKQKQELAVIIIEKKYNK